MKKVRIFVSCVTPDQQHEDRLDVHLAGLRSTGRIDPWFSSRAEPGKHVAREIDKNLLEADLVLLLVSADFLACPSCNRQMEVALARQARGECRVVPILVRHVELKHTRIAGLSALPSSAVPISGWLDPERAWVEVVNEIDRSVEALRSDSALPEPASIEPESDGAPACEETRLVRAPIRESRTTMDHCVVARPPSPSGAGRVLPARAFLQAGELFCCFVRAPHEDLDLLVRLETTEDGSPRDRVDLHVTSADVVKDATRLRKGRLRRFPEDLRQWWEVRQGVAHVHLTLLASGSLRQALLLARLDPPMASRGPSVGGALTDTAATISGISGALPRMLRSEGEGLVCIRTELDLICRHSEELTR